MHNTHCVKNKKFKENVTMTKTSKKIGIITVQGHRLAIM